MTNLQRLMKANEEGYPMRVNNGVTAKKKYQYGGELALLRKEIHHIEEELHITPTQEFAEYYAEVEEIKQEAKEELEING